MLVAADLNPGDTPEAIVESFWEMFRTLDEEEGGDGGKLPRGRVRRFVEERVYGVLRNIESIDASIDRFLVLGGWEMFRLGAVEKAVLRVGVWELSNTDAPVGVVVNEAIDICNWFSTPKSRSLINGVLDRYAKSR